MNSPHNAKSFWHQLLSIFILESRILQLADVTNNENKIQLHKAKNCWRHFKK